MPQKESFLLEYQQSFKSREVEDWLDRSFYRPMGFFFAKMGQFFRVSPTTITVVGTILGFGAAWFYCQPGSWPTVFATFLFIGSGILDSADGQLARITNRASKMGRILDGISDNLVFSSIYIAGTLTAADRLGDWVWSFAVLGGLSHFMQSSVLDYYTQAYLTLGLGKEIESQNSSSSKHSNQTLIKVERIWLYSQKSFSGRSASDLHEFHRLCRGAFGKSFQSRYRAKNKRILQNWRILGANTHTAGIIVAMFLGKFEYYLIFEIIFLNLIFFYLRSHQIKTDKKLKQETEIKIKLFNN